MSKEAIIMMGRKRAPHVHQAKARQALISTFFITYEFFYTLAISRDLEALPAG
jgi:hypothetical protein